MKKERFKKRKGQLLRPKELLIKSKLTQPRQRPRESKLRK